MAGVRVSIGEGRVFRIFSAKNNLVWLQRVISYLGGALLWAVGVPFNCNFPFS